MTITGGVCESLTFKANMQQRQIKKLKRELKRANKLQEIEEEEIQYLRGRNVFFLERGGESYKGVQRECKLKGNNKLSFVFKQLNFM